MVGCYRTLRRILPSLGASAKIEPALIATHAGGLLDGVMHTERRAPPHFRFRILTWLVDAGRRTGADLTRSKNVAEGIIGPDIRAAVGVLIDHCKYAHWRSDRHSVPKDNIVSTADVNFDAVSAQIEQSAIHNGIGAGTVRQ
jgi:hypothetical protein